MGREDGWPRAAALEWELGKWDLIPADPCSDSLELSGADVGSAGAVSQAGQEFHCCIQGLR